MANELVESMSKPELVDRLARAIAAREGFFVTEAQAKERRLKFTGLRSRRPGAPAYRSGCRATLAGKNENTPDDQSRSD